VQAPKFIRFEKIPDRDGRTDRQTDAHSTDTTRRHVGSKKITFAAYNIWCHYKQLFGLRNFRRLGPNLFFEISGANCSSLIHLRRVVIWHFVGRADPYQSAEDGLNRFISDCAGRLRTWPEIVVFYEMPCLRPPPTGGTAPPLPPLLFRC